MLSRRDLVIRHQGVPLWQNLTFTYSAGELVELARQVNGVSVTLGRVPGWMAKLHRAYVLPDGSPLPWHRHCSGTACSPYPELPTFNPWREAEDAVHARSLILETLRCFVCSPERLIASANAAQAGSWRVLAILCARLTPRTRFLITATVPTLNHPPIQKR